MFKLACGYNILWLDYHLHHVVYSRTTNYCIPHISATQMHPAAAYSRGVQGMCYLKYVHVCLILVLRLWVG